MNIIRPFHIFALRAFLGQTVREEKLTRLSRAAGVHLLQALGVRGSLFRNISLNDGNERVNEFEKLVEDVKGHALTLNLLGTYLRDAHAGDIRKRNLVKLEEADAENEHRHHAFHVMDAYVRWLESGAPVSQPAERRAESEFGTPSRRALAILRLIPARLVRLPRCLVARGAHRRTDQTPSSASAKRSATSPSSDWKTPGCSR